MSTRKLPRPEFPLVWDNTMRSTFRACPRKAAWEYFHHFKPLGQSIHLHAGKAWAKGMEMARKAYYTRGLSASEAEAIGAMALIAEYGDFDAGDHAKSCARLVEALVYYFTHFPLETDPCKPYIGHAGPMIEFSFALPLHPSLRHPVTGEPIIYAGRADMIATFAGAVSVFDDKTATALGKSWASQWDLRSQFSGYVWAAQQFGIHVSQVVVRGIAILKTMFNHAQSITARPQYAIERWHYQAVQDIRRAIACWEEGYYDYAFDDTCSAYGGCLFRQPCQSQDQASWLTGGNYAIRVWNPIERAETPLPEAA